MTAFAGTSRVHDATGADESVVADRDVARMVAPERLTPPAGQPVRSTFQVLSVCNPPFGAVARGTIVDEHDAVTDEDVVFDTHPFADEGVAGYFNSSCRR